MSKGLPFPIAHQMVTDIQRAIQKQQEQEALMRYITPGMARNQFYAKR